MATPCPLRLDSNTIHTPGYGPELCNQQQEEKLLSTKAVTSYLYQAIVGRGAVLD